MNSILPCTRHIAIQFYINESKTVGYSAYSIINFIPSKQTINACFIRAPKVLKFSKKIKCLAKLNENPILLTDGYHLASSFHPEYSSDFQVYNYFKNIIKGS